jgi:hypothetical protein
VGFGYYTSRFTPQFGCLGSFLYALITPLTLVALGLVLWWFVFRHL